MNTSLIIVVVLILLVILVNGWTDAPNAIATVVGTGCMKFKNAVIMASLCNFAGVVVMSLLGAKVAQTIGNIVNFQGENALIALAAGLTAIIIFAVIAWCFGIPTSESHALIAGVTGAAISLGGVSAVNAKEWGKILIGLVVSVIFGLIFGYISAKIIILFSKSRNSDQFFQNAQIISSAATAFFHGAQDGQKFIGVFMMGSFLAQGKNVPQDFEVPVYVMLLCSFVMALGTSIGGERIIKSVGMDMVKLEKYQGFSADFSSSICLLGCSIFGVPVSTTHVKTTAIMGVGMAKGKSEVKWKIVKDMISAWFLTFPICGLIGFLMVKLFGFVF